MKVWVVKFQTELERAFKSFIDDYWKEEREVGGEISLTRTDSFSISSVCLAGHCCWNRQPAAHLPSAVVMEYEIIESQWGALDDSREIRWKRLQLNFVSFDKSIKETALATLYSAD